MEPQNQLSEVVSLNQQPPSGLHSPAAQNQHKLYFHRILEKEKLNVSHYKCQRTSFTFFHNYKRHNRGAKTKPDINYMQ